MTPTAPLSPLPCQSPDFIHLRIARIEEDIEAAQEKIRRIEFRIGRDREALAAWRLRLAAITNEHTS